MFKLLRMTVFLSWLFFFITDTYAGETQRLKLSDCYALAIENNLSIAILKNKPVIFSWREAAEKAIFDPNYDFSMNYMDAKTPTTSLTRSSTGFDCLESDVLRFDTGISGLIPIGTRYDLSFSDTKTTGTVTRFESEYDGVLSFSLTQPLLKNFGLASNLIRLRIARINKEISEEELRNVLINTLNRVQVKYWDLVLAIREYEVYKESLNLAKTLLEDNKKRVEVGILPPIEITQSEAGVAAREEAVIIGEQRISQRENDLKTLIYLDTMDIIGKKVVPIDEPLVKEKNLSFDESLKNALSKRSEYLIAKKNIESKKMETRFYRNQRLPEVNFVGRYNMKGVDGNFGNTLDKVASEETREWILGVEVKIPLGNRVAKSKSEISRIELKNLEYESDRIKLNLVRDVSNAVANVRTNFKRVKATKASRRLAEEALNSEIKKLETGASTSHDVLIFQEELSKAKIKEISSIIDLNKSLFELSRVEGTVLDKLGIELEK